MAVSVWLLPPDWMRTMPANDDAVLELTRGSSLLLLLRMMYSEMLDYAVYVPDDAPPVIISKEKVIVLVERGYSDSPISSLPSLAEQGLLRPMSIDSIDSPESVNALLIERRGTWVSAVSDAVFPPSPEFPVWWDAPVPFAMCTRSGLKLNNTASEMFGTDIERLSVAGIPEKDEFIVEIQGRESPLFLVFRRLRPDIFTLEDCTGDMVEAQDISWWASVGRTWTSSLEDIGCDWMRAESVPDDFQGRAWRCEWQGRFQGYLCVSGMQDEDAPRPKPKKTLKTTNKLKKTSARHKEQEEAAAKDDDVLKAIGPQTMALIAPGQPRDAAPPEERYDLPV